MVDSPHQFILLIVLIAVRNKFKSYLLPINEPTVQRVVYVSIELYNESFIIDGVYFLPLLSVKYFNAYFENVEHIIFSNNNTKLLLLDFNLPKLKWRFVSEGLLSGSSCLGSMESEFVSFLSYINLRKFNFVTNQN